MVPSIASAWEADGFKSGDAVGRVEQELASWGVGKRPRAPHANSKDMYTFSARDRWFTFCRDRLVEYDRQFIVTMSEFARMIESEVAKRGQPKVETGPVTIAERGVWFEWSEGGQIMLLILAQGEKGSLEATRRFTAQRLKSECANGAK